jgi:hypothetical protein
MPALSEKLIADVIVTIVTKPPDEYAEKYRIAFEKSIERLKAVGAKIITEHKIHQRFVVIDRHIVWCGSVNPLGYDREEDNIVRLDGANAVMSLLNQRFGKSDRYDSADEMKQLELAVPYT